MTMSKNPYKNIRVLGQVARYFPVIGAEKIIGVRLPYYQQDILNRLWTHKYPLLFCSRRTGKTFVTALFLVLKAMLYPKTNIGISAPVFKQAKTVFKMVEDLYKEYPIVQMEAAHQPKHNNTEWSLGFKNGSYIEAVPFNDNIRSKGYNIVFLDEYGFQFRYSMNQMVSSVITPMIFTKRQKAGPSIGKEDTNEELHETDIGNQLIIASTGTYKWNDYYKKYKEYEEHIYNGNSNYDIISYDYRDGLDSGLFEEELVKNEFEKADPITRKMEYLNVFPDDTGNFIPSQLIYEKAVDTAEAVDEENDVYIEPKTKIEFEQETDDQGFPNNKYVMAFDDADQGPNNFTVALIKLDGEIKRLVRVMAANKAYIDDKVKMIRDLLRKFNVVLITADQRHKNIKDGLAKPYTYPDGTEAPIILDKHDEEQHSYIKKKFGTSHQFEKLIHIHNFTHQSNEERARHFLGQIEQGKFKIPADPRGGYESKREEEAYNEIKETIFEITAIKAKPYQNIIRYERENRRDNKDRWTVCELGCYMADQYLRGMGNRMNNKFQLGKWGK